MGSKDNIILKRNIRPEQMNYVTFKKNSSMPSLKIVHKRIGYSNTTLLVNQQGAVLVDTGVQGNFKKFRILFRKAGLSPKDIKLIILTHTHYDHTGNLQKLADYTGAQVMVHQNEFENLKNGFTPIPNGQGKYSGFISKLGRKVVPCFASPKAFSAHLINEDIFDLKRFGIEGKVISTPGHTDGSQSILIGDKLISGDTFLNMKNGRIFPPFANDPEILLKTWEKLFRMNIKTVYPGHGKRFNIENAVPDYKRWTQKLSLDN